MKLTTYTIFASAALLSACAADSNNDNDTDQSDPIAEFVCPFNGNISYRLNGDDTWPEAVKNKLQTAMDEAVWYYN